MAAVWGEEIIEGFHTCALSFYPFLLVRPDHNCITSLSLSLEVMAPKRKSSAKTKPKVKPKPKAAATDISFTSPRAQEESGSPLASPFAVPNIFSNVVPNTFSNLAPNDVPNVDS